jgi:AraC family transcriptional regulator, transcriptional activator of pobA
MITTMNQEFPLRDAQSFEIVRSLFRVFMIYLRRKFEGYDTGSGAAKDKLMVQRFFTLLQQHHVSKKQVADYADELCITPNYFNTMVKKHTGFPVSYHIQQYIIVEAKRHAMYSGLRMKEVAERLGFDDYAHFSKFFKNYSGMNFSDFRRTRIV